MASIHDTDAVGDLRQKSEIVGDIEHRHVKPVSEIVQQGDDLLLGGDIKAGGRFVKHDKIGLARKRNGDADSLLLTAR